MAEEPTADGTTTFWKFEQQLKLCRAEKAGFNMPAEEGYPPRQNSESSQHQVLGERLKIKKQ
jgi:hypothetical protein